MTKAILYILLMAYSANLVKPVLPYVSDAVSHLLWYSEHVSTVHYENGKYHVHVEAMKAVTKTGMPSSADTGKKENKLSEHLSSHIAYTFTESSLADLCFPPVTSTLPFCFAAYDYPPPKM